MTATGAEPWPLSAATTRVLRGPRTEVRELFALAMKELVARRVWLVERKDRGRRPPRVRLRPGPVDAPALPPLRTLDRRLRRAWDDGAETMALLTLVQRLGDGTARALRDEAREELARRGLVELERRKVLGVVPRTVVTVTRAGTSWQRVSYAREEGVVRTLRAPSVDPEELAEQVAALGGIVLLLSSGPLAELDAVLRRLGDDGEFLNGTSYGGLDVDLDLDLSFLSGVDGSVFDGAFDSAVDAGGGGDGGGGDGGGGGE